MCKKSPRCEPVYIYETNNKLRQKSATCVPIPSVQQLWLLGLQGGLGEAVAVGHAGDLIAHPLTAEFANHKQFTT